MKKMLITLSLLLGILGGGSFTYASLDHPTIYVNDEESQLAGVVPPSGSTLVPFRTVFAVVGMDVTWDNKTKSVTATKEGLEIKMQSGSHDAYVNEKKVQLIQTPALENNIFYVNLRFISEAAGGTVSWKKLSDNDAEIRITLP
ncbi:Copper amine oxidase N-terminal domain-containing protein [Paenibacillus sp. UNC496MF]|uniref:copper amine oxidase N-terminal domain-containing protein n=1 Tax=Paenibacillus sp. UNC496MF TaxID=1502753 RepID=UPI0008F176D9|nr:copper amine oxidase N-terminal domain-containing protein [Paenibacillus sp. UNC496MF]SFJ56234.1 Copper amine oxidase N-terminal domain-containing protein [Paenibacillus sp. UNC496MF]